MKHFIQRLLLTLLLLPAFIYAETITYFIPDAQGSTIAKTNEEGEVIWRAERLPYGQNINLSNEQIDDSPLQYTGAPLDSYSGLTYLKARYYNADIGRFYAIDPVWFQEDNVQMFNRYAYANNNPYRYVDPTGMEGDEQDLINELRNARRGGRTAEEFEEDTNELLTDSVKVGVIAGAEAGGGKFLGKFFSWLGKSKKVTKVDLFGGKTSSLKGYKNYDLQATAGIKDDVANFGKHFKPNTLKHINVDNPMAPFIEHVAPSLKKGGIITIKGQFGNKNFRNVWKAKSIDGFKVINRTEGLSSKGYYKSDGSPIQGKMNELVLEKL